MMKCGGSRAAGREPDREHGATMNPLPRSALLCALLLSTAASAASTLIGTVVDARSQQPVPDVVVTVTSPALEGEKVVVSDAQGNYRVPELPPGLYTLRFEKEAFTPYGGKEIKLRQNRTVRFNPQLMPVTMTKAEALAAVRPTIDISDTMSCAPVAHEEFIKRIAVARPRSSPAYRSPVNARVDSARDRTPSWMLSRMPILVPDGMPQLVYRAPSAARGSPDFGH
jgi:hypothetical protein